MREKSYYEILGVQPISTENEISDAYKRLSRMHHPDMGGDSKIFQCLQAAAEVLRDKKKRKAYDTLRKFTMNTCDRCAGAGVIYRQQGFTNRIKLLCPSCEGVGLFPRSK